MKAIIIDDEIRIVEGIQRMIARYCPEVEVIGTAGSVKDGLHLIETLDMDIVFLDIQLHDGTGIDLLNRLTEQPFQIIFITAYNEYAIEAFKFSAVDYLLKPLDPEDLVQAVHKARQHIEKDSLHLRLSVLLENMEALSQQMKKIIIKDAENIHIINIADIFCCKADGCYTAFTLQDGQVILSSKNLKTYENMLHNYAFFRSHHSYLVNLHQIKRFEKTEGGQLILQNDMAIPVSTRKKDRLFDILSELNI